MNNVTFDVRIDYQIFIRRNTKTPTVAMHRNKFIINYKVLHVVRTDYTVLKHYDK